MVLHRFLTLSKSSKTSKVVPELRDVTLKANAHISDETLLEYQHDLRTNSTYFNIKLTLNPANTDISALQQYFIVNGLCDEFMFELDYDNSIITSATDYDTKEELLVEYAKNTCNEKISRELEIAEKLLSTDVTDFFTCIAKKVDSLLNGEIDSVAIESGTIPLTEKSSNIYLEWFSIIEPCIQELVEAAGLDTREFSIENPFELIDLNRLKPLGSMFGEIYEGTSSWAPYTTQVRKYHVGSVRICPSDRISEEQIKKCIAHCAASFFVNIAKSPLGRKFLDSASDLQQKYISLAKKHYELVESIIQEENFASAKQAHINANILIDELGAEAERLKLAIEQNLHFVAIYHETLTNHIRSGIEIALKQNLKELYSCENVDVSSSIKFVGPDPENFSQRGKLGAINSPGLLTLRVSQIVMNYFSEHTWLAKLNINKPEIEVLAEYGAGHDGSAAALTGEFVLVKNFILDRLIPKNSEMAIEINKIALDFGQDGDEISILRGMARER